MDEYKTILYWQPYKHFPYEKLLGIREVQALLSTGENLLEQKSKLLTSGALTKESAERLVYFSHFQINGQVVETNQFRVEQRGRNGVASRKQNTRYASHGLHEYKGKFNPQVVKALFNIFRVPEKGAVLDPFCGSGTTLIEASLYGLNATGTDINPLAVFIANAKILALTTPWEVLQVAVERFMTDLKKEQVKVIPNDERLEYLQSWFPPEILSVIETARSATAHLPEGIRQIILSIVSNLLRDYSLQEPSDLRIRRRKSPLPTMPLEQAVRDELNAFLRSIKVFQSSEKIIHTPSAAYNVDIREENPIVAINQFDFAVTSPPYATALPYIDTQRLSLVWLDLVPVSQIRPLDGSLIGSREFHSKSQHNGWSKLLKDNYFQLPESIHTLCLQLHNRLNMGDGFRKQAVPELLYRYFYDMRQAFANVYSALKPGAFFALIVGHNHTTIGGVKTDIDTPAMLGIVGESIGFKLTENTSLEVYQRYGMHMNNAVQKESLLVFQKP
ncbi:MAG: hypothetical protein EPGJADBJ_00077 [Saprospiraceae bacterium]|nr:hypothetical protein [Saprospiraceae bacterium]